MFFFYAILYVCMYLVEIIHGKIKLENSFPQTEKSISIFTAVCLLIVFAHAHTGTIHNKSKF